MKNLEIGRSPKELFLDYLAGRYKSVFPQATGRSVIFTQSGRAAILLATRLWGISSDDEVLIPAYNCGSDVSPLIATGARVSMYRISGNARVDFEDLNRRITQRTRLIHVIHYFGWPTDLSELAALCREKNIKLLEDCALSLFSGNIGRMGDGAIFSFYKTLPTCSGGALVLRDNHFPSYPIEPSNKSHILRESFSLLRKWVKIPFLIPNALISNPIFLKETHDYTLSPLPDIPAGYYCYPNTAVHEGSRLIQGAIRRANVAGIVQARRKNYEMLRCLLLQEPYPPLLWDGPLDLEICPLGLPLLVRNKSVWCKKLNASGIPVSPWWSGFHKGLNWSEYPEAMNLKKHLILLPVHQNLSSPHMEYIARAVHSIGSELDIQEEVHRKAGISPPRF